MGGNAGMKPFVLVIDQGTTSTRAFIFDAAGHAVGSAQRELRQYFPRDGWIEHDPEEIWHDTLVVCRGAIAAANVAPSEIACIGIANQRETAILWDRATGAPLHNAIVWQDRRTAAACRDLVRDGAEPMVAVKTGLLIDPYFSATKLAWLLDHIPGAREQAERGELCFGTVDSFLLFRLTEGTVHATDVANASRTALFDIHRQEWDRELLDLFRIPAPLLPAVRDNAASFGMVAPTVFGASLPITGMAGDQQAALVGQGCFVPGMIKSTYGTGCFVLMNSGAIPVQSRHRLLTTIAYRLDGKAAYAVEGSIFVAGAAIQWLRDGLRVIADADSSARIAAELPDESAIYLVPAFTGLGAPHWLPEARGAIFGLTRDTTGAHLARGALEAVCYQTRDLIDAIVADGGTRPVAMRVDGGMARNDWMLQFLADTLDLPVERPAFGEATALGAACLAATGAGLCASPETFGSGWRLDRRFEPTMPAARREALYAGWRKAVAVVKDYTRSTT